jgi:hypothetical protein
MKDNRKTKPRILSAVDLTHLQPNERIGLLGNENLKNRREFLEKLLKAGIAVGLPAILFSGCEPEIKYIVTDEEDCPTYTPTAGNNPCACNTDATAAISPRIVNTVPAKNSTFINESAGTEIRIDFDKLLDSATLTGAVAVTPQPSGDFDIHFFDLSKNNAGIKSSVALFKPGTSSRLVLLDDTSYTVTVKGTVKDVNGKLLDGNSDGTGGDDFTYTFKTVKKYNSCICQADTCTCQSDRPCMGDSYCASDPLPCLSHNSCTCQNKSCSCHGNTCYYGCTFDSCFCQANVK